MAHLGDRGPQLVCSVLYPLPAEDEPLLPEIPRCDANVLETSVVTPASWLSNTFREILTYRSFVSEFHNFMYGLHLHTDYLQNSQFQKWKGTGGQVQGPALSGGEQWGPSGLGERSRQLWPCSPHFWPCHHKWIMGCASRVRCGYLTKRLYKSQSSNGLLLQTEETPFFCSCAKHGLLKWWLLQVGRGGPVWESLSSK